ncbi:MAG: hypothetical protein ACREJN_16270, partial [Nitrospiraceae bacterium]
MSKTPKQLLGFHSGEGEPTTVGSLAKRDGQQDNKQIIFSLSFTTPTAARGAGWPTSPASPL